MPVDVRIGKMLIMGAVLRCVDPILTIAASLSHRSPFFSDQRNKGTQAAPSQQRIRGVYPVSHASSLLLVVVVWFGAEAASSAHRRLAGNLFSDHLTIVKAYNE
jgi:HrpA-like RNA helicase